MLIPLTSYPFDFASYVYQVRQFFDYGIDPLFYWNKGMLLHLLFFMQYALYDLIIWIFGYSENVSILHLIFKFPFFLFDLITALFIYKISVALGVQKKFQYPILLLWLFNPFATWVVEIQGKYAIFATALVMVSIYTLINKRFFSALILLSAATSVYYYPIILCPLFILYIYQESGSSSYFIKTTCRYGLVFILSLLLFFCSFIFFPKNIDGLLGSLLHHTQPDAPKIANEIFLPSYSLFKVPFYLVNDFFPSNLSNPTFFNDISKVTFFGLGAVICYYLFLLRSFFVRGEYMSRVDLIRHILSVLLLFLIFIGKLQSHYLVWILPLVLIFAFAQANRVILLIYFSLSIIPMVVTLGRTNLATFFIDSLEWGEVNLWFNSDKLIGPFLGASVMLLLLFLLIEIQKKVNRSAYESTKNQCISFTLYSILFLSIISHLLFLYPTLKAYNSFLNQSFQENLRASKNTLVFGTLIEAVNEGSVDNKSHTNIVFSDSFSEPTRSGIELSDIWSFYPNGGEQYAGIIERLPGEFSLDLKFGLVEYVGEVSMGGSGSKNLIPIDSDTDYSLGFSVASLEGDNNYLKAKVRFADKSGRVISGSDILFDEFAIGADWRQVWFDFRSKNSKARYLEVVFSLDQEKIAEAKYPKGSILVDDISILSSPMSKKRTYAVFGKSNGDIVQKTIIDDSGVSRHFNLTVQIDGLSDENAVDSIVFNNCELSYSNKSLKMARLIYSGDSSCINFTSKNNLTILYNDVPLSSDVRVYVDQDDLTRTNIYKSRHKHSGLVLSLISIVINIIILFYLVFSFRLALRDK